ncbi:collagen alpha-2(I) chain-like [Rattus norvegicus]|uniref:collagen alpha-2(I) chain-like n=1 Tax=Rattus norvegicus TaxID=10116 RepID=UPI00191739A1|nr:collagen alpha-2(I) chain-like [Rattus norvegicus]
MELPNPSPFLSERSPFPGRGVRAGPEAARSIPGARGEHGGPREPGAEGPSPAPAFRAGWWRKPESGARTASAGLGREGAGPFAPGGPEQASCRRVRWLRSPPGRGALGPLRPHDPRQCRASRVRQAPPAADKADNMAPSARQVARKLRRGRRPSTSSFPRMAALPPAAAHPARGRAGKL